MLIVFDPILGSLRKADVADPFLADDFSAHIRNKVIHVTQEDKNNWNKDSEIDASLINQEILIIK